MWPTNNKPIDAISNKIIRKNDANDNSDEEMYNNCDDYEIYSRNSSKVRLIIQLVINFLNSSSIWLGN